jgi:hypothetical protein
MNPRRALAFAGLVIVSSVVACWGNDPTAADGPYDINVVFNNQDSQAAHLFAVDKGEDFPCCRLDPGQSRTVQVLHVNEIVVRAGRNGAELSKTTCKLVAADRSQPKNITWLGNAWYCN